ncbi:MAG: gene transfer agent family protein [Robiginitomaculum sp.]|nr:gene transfer agent family protein [Robiginitomaculum sp.]
MINGYQKGDVAVKIEGRNYRLRLTLGSLAEIETRLGVKGPLELAQKIRSFGDKNRSSDEAVTLLECLMCAPGHTGATRIPAMVKRAKPMDYMPAIATLFEETFA